MEIDTLSRFFCHFFKERQFCWFALWFPVDRSPPEKGSTPKEKNLHHREQILSFQKRYLGTKAATTFLTVASSENVSITKGFCWLECPDQPAYWHVKLSFYLILQRKSWFKGLTRSVIFWSDGLQCLFPWHGQIVLCNQ